MIYPRPYTFVQGHCTDPDIPIHIRANGCLLRITLAQSRRGWVFGLDIRTPFARTFIRCEDREPHFRTSSAAILEALHEAERWTIRNTTGDIRQFRTLIRRNRQDYIL